MGQIYVEFDNSLDKSSIITPVVASSKDEAGENYRDAKRTDKAQTKVVGILAPLISINNTVIDIDSVINFTLSSEKVLPQLTMTVNDKYKVITNIDKPGVDNEVRIQILPQFENAYKKIDLTFYISKMSVNNNHINIIATYKSPDLMSSHFGSFGSVDTYTLFKTVAAMGRLGFASNISNTNDERYVYSANKSLLTLMEKQIAFATADNIILDYWIDFWDNLNLVDVKDRYNTVDPIEEMKVWSTRQTEEINANTEVTPNETAAILTNHPGQSNSDMFVSDYKIINDTKSNEDGTDCVYSIYEESKHDYRDYLTQDGDVKNDIFTKYEYLGECYGSYNYFMSGAIRQGFLKKMNLEKVEVTLKMPTLALMRGGKVNFIRYVNDDFVEAKKKSLKDAGILDETVNSNIDLSDYEAEITKDGPNYRLDRTVSAQYFINGVRAEFKNNQWKYILTLVRPAIDKPNIINTEE